MSRLFDHIGTGTLDQAYHDQNDDDGYIGDIGLPSGVTITDREIAESAAADRTGHPVRPTRLINVICIARTIPGTLSFKYTRKMISHGLFPMLSAASIRP